MSPDDVALKRAERRARGETEAAGRTAAPDPLWYKDAVIYQLHVKSYFDSDNDGVGDFRGLVSKLDYIADLGVTAVWLLPFYPSPRRDDGYDIAEYKDVHPDYGDLEDVRAFISEAHRRGLKVVTELVINHTSDQHPWFQRARRAPRGSPERDYYVWSDDDKKWPETRIIFLDTETSNWTWDPVAEAYYWHRFYSHQPDLNFDNPKVLEEVLDVMRFWLDAGVDGLRLDAIPYLVERDGTNNENLPETHEVLRRIRAALDERHPGRMLLAEANQWPEDTQTYFGNGDECHMAFHFPLMPRMYMAIAQEDRFPITDIMRQTPEIPETCQWAIFLRNHDELTLEMVTDEERDYLWNTYAADRRARINLGIRRRLAPLLERDRRRIELMNFLLLTMPGTPVIYYGDEIGMGDNIHLGDRDGVRTPMQWSPDRNGGFSRADPAELVLPTIQDPLYGFLSLNVEAQSRDPHSLLNWLKRMLAVRVRQKAFGRGRQIFLRPRNRKVLAYLREFEGSAILCVANLSRTPQAVELDLADYAGRTPVELSGNTPFPPIGQLTYLLTLPPYGFYWFDLKADQAGPDWSASSNPEEVEQETFVLRGDITDILTPRAGDLLEREVLPAYLPQRRWFQAKNARIEAVRIAGAVPAPGGESLIAELAVRTTAGEARYVLPFAPAFEGEPAGPYAPLLSMARVRRGRRVGRLTDGFATTAMVRTVLEAFSAGAALAGEGGERLVFEADAPLDLGEAPQIEWLSAEQSNSSVIIDRRYVLKLLRRISAGRHPEAEMSRALTQRGFASTPPFFGEARLSQPGEEADSTVFVLQGFVHNQGDGWSYTLNLLHRLADDAEPDLEPYLALARVFGRRLAEMHAALAAPSEDPDFTPETAGEADAAGWAAGARDLLERAVEGLRALEDGEEETGRLAREAVEGAQTLAGRLAFYAREGSGTPKTRIHGDLHLGQVLITKGDVSIIDFEGEPARPLEERRAKSSPMRDVAGVLRSFDYAALVSDRDAPAETREAEGRARAVSEAFRRSAPDAFLAGYREAGGVLNEPLLRLFLIEKAAYEVLYELANRPTWVKTPLTGLVELARAAAEDAS